jgi:DNA invertase Pin-like site-specific DNA recombinase
MKKVGYVRVSTEDQKTIRQSEYMEELGVDKVFIEKVSGKSTEGRDELIKMLDYVEVGDVIVVSEFSRLARNLRDLLSIVDVLKRKGVAFQSKKEAIDTGSVSGEFMLAIFGALSEFERKQMLERQREGIEIAKREGKYKGRKPLEVNPDKFSKVYKRWKSGEFTAIEAMAVLGLKRGTFYRRVKDYEEAQRASV